MDRQMGASEAPEVIPRCQTRTRIAQFQKGRFSPSGFTFLKGRLWCVFGASDLSSPLAVLEKKEFHKAVSGPVIIYSRYAFAGCLCLLVAVFRTFVMECSVFVSALCIEGL